MSDRDEFSEEHCAEGLTFYDLRPHFVATHYGQESGKLPQNIAHHMEGCVACRERWQFLINTDPRLSESYWEEMEEIHARFRGEKEIPVRDTPSSQGVREAILDLTKGETVKGGKSPTIEEVHRVWHAVRSIEDDELRRHEAEYLALTCGFLQDEREEKAKAVKYLMHIRDSRSREPILIQSLTEVLAVAGCDFTSYIRELAVFENFESGFRLYPDRFRQAKELYEQRVGRAVPVKS